MYIHTITAEDIGKSTLTILKCAHCNIYEKIYIHDVMGRILPCDVGKRIYKNNGIFQVENNEQLKKRLLIA